MTYLRNCWYVGCMSGELADGPIARTILGEKLVMFRSDDGKPGVLADLCPHRFVRLSSGKVVGHAIECPYHGLRFDGSGMCVHQPFEAGDPAPHNRVRSYPVVERGGYVWMWPGEPHLADPAAIPASMAILGDRGLKTVYGYLRVAGNYQLVTDNLLDLSHVDFIHPEARLPEGFETYENKVEQRGDQVINWLWKPDSTPNFLQAALRESSSVKADVFSHMEWNAPSLMMLRTGLQDVGEPEGSDFKLPSAHLLTPETETSTHYFWTVGRDRKKDDTAIDEMFLTGLTHIFTTQDGPMIEQAQQGMGNETDLFALRPVILSSDAAAVRARRVLQKLIREEEGERDPAPPRVIRR
jgi:phenylpropionate dioxygenase-like ring-hydroxylating dioxygenase large terminal subunit